MLAKKQRKLISWPFRRDEKTVNLGLCCFLQALLSRQGARGGPEGVPGRSAEAPGARPGALGARNGPGGVPGRSAEAPGARSGAIYAGKKQRKLISWPFRRDEKTTNLGLCCFLQAFLSRQGARGAPEGVPGRSAAAPRPRPGALGAQHGEFYI